MSNLIFSPSQAKSFTIFDDNLLTNSNTNPTDSSLKNIPYQTLESNENNNYQFSSDNYENSKIDIKSPLLGNKVSK